MTLVIGPVLLLLYQSRRNRGQPSYELPMVSGVEVFVLEHLSGCCFYVCESHTRQAALCRQRQAALCLQRQAALCLQRQAALCLQRQAALCLQRQAALCLHAMQPNGYMHTIRHTCQGTVTLLDTQLLFFCGNTSSGDTTILCTS